MSFVAEPGNPDEHVREEVLKLKKLERECRKRALAAAACGKPDTARNAMARAREHSVLRCVK